MIFIAVAIFIVLRIPSLFEPHWYGDEGIYASVAYAIEHGKKLYLEVYDNRLPGIYYLYALGNSEYRMLWIRSINVIAGIITLIYLSRIGNQLKLSKYIKIGLVFAVIFLGSPIWEANIANTENFFIPFTAAAIYYALRNRQNIFLSGLLFGIAFLFKFNPFFTFASLGYYTTFINLKHKKIPAIDLISYVLGFFIPFIIACVFMFSRGILGAGLQYALLNNTGYIEKYATEGIPLTVRILVFACVVIAATGFYIKNKMSRVLFFIITLFAFDTFSVFFSGRQYTHYLLQMILPISLLLSYIGRYQFLHINRLRAWLTISVVIGTLIALFIVYISVGDVKNQVNTNPIDYYYSFYNGLRGTPQPLELFTFFSENKKILEAKRLHTILADERHVFHTNESWIYDYLQINPPTIFVAAYHNLFIPNGMQRYIRDIEVYKPDSLLIDKSIEKHEEFDKYVAEHYSLTAEHEYFIQYRKSR